MCPSVYVGDADSSNTKRRRGGAKVLQYINWKERLKGLRVNDGERDIFPAATVLELERQVSNENELGNPFADDFAAPAPVKNLSQQPVNPSLSNGFSNMSLQPPAPINSPFVCESNFNTVFGQRDLLGGVWQPTSLHSNSSLTSSQQNSTNHQQEQQQQQHGGALITGDLESSLAYFEENLSISNRLAVNVQWNSPKNGSKVFSLQCLVMYT
ncbi:lap [Trypoxylus dichotomus]